MPNVNSFNLNGVNHSVEDTEARSMAQKQVGSDRIQNNAVTAEKIANVQHLGEPIAIGRDASVVTTTSTVVDPTTSATRNASNLAIGNNARVTAGWSNTVMGINAHVTAGQQNTALGNHARVRAGTASVALGNNSNVEGTAERNNTALGCHTHVNAGLQNTVLGCNARILAPAGNHNTALGTNAHVTAGHSNVALGFEAGVTKGYNNVALGYNTHVASVRQSTAVGNRAQITSGSANTALGNNARIYETAYRNNTALGCSAHITTGQGNTTVGCNAHVTAGNHNTALGNGARVTAANSAGSTAIGRFANASHTSAVILAPNNSTDLRPTTAANRITLGFAGITTAGWGGFAEASDARDKTDISELAYDPLAFINALSPKQYRMDFRSSYTRFEEITSSKFRRLDKYTQMHDVYDVQVYGIEGTAIEWIEDELFSEVTEDDPSPSVRRSNADDRYRTTFTGDYVKDRDAAIELFKKDNPVIKRLLKDYEALDALEKSESDAEALESEIEIPIEDFDVEDLIKPVRTTRFQRVYLEPDGTRAGKRYHSGFLAQDVQQTAQDMGFDFAGVEYLAHNKDEDGVSEGDDLYNMKYSELIAPMVGAIQHLAQVVKDLQGELAALKA